MIGVVLAGGRSSRFGGTDKTFIVLAGKPLLSHVLERLAPQVDTVAINSNQPAEQFQAFNVRVMPDLLPGLPGPLAGIHAALTAWPTQKVVTVAVDLALLPRDLVQRLDASLAPGRCRYAASGGHHALAMLWAPGLAPEVERFIAAGGRSVRELLARVGDPVELPPTDDADCMLNINDADALANAEHRLRSGSRTAD